MESFMKGKAVKKARAKRFQAEIVKTFRFE